MGISGMRTWMNRGRGRGRIAAGVGRGPGRGRIAAGAGALAAALVLALLPLPDGADQASAAPRESSAVTLTGKKGPYDDFSKLKVTVHQTKGLRGQGVRITWAGGKPKPAGTVPHHFMSFMQCWGDDAAKGPSREQCEYGISPGAKPGDGRAINSIDPLESYDSLPTDPAGVKYVRFRPVEGPATKTSVDTTYFGPEDTNAVPFAPNTGDGGGEAAFELKSSVESPHLGCGARRTASGAVKPCWLVAVPRGSHHPDGRVVEGSGHPVSSLSRTNWDQRLAFRLDFLPVGDNCAADKAERRTIGSELVTDAMTSWQSALCRGGTHRFTFTQSGEGEARSAVTSPGGSSPGLAFTVDPVRAEEGAAPVVQAPVAISGLTVGMFWMYEDKDAQGAPRPYQLHGVRLNQRLLAKALTQSYVDSVRYLRQGVDEPASVKGNPRKIGLDPEFQKLNPDLKALANWTQAPLGLLVSTENSDATRLLWRYLAQNKDAREFLQGKPDPWGMKVNSHYPELGLDEQPADFYPKADATVSRAPCGDGSQSLPYGGQDIVPYATDMHSAALKIRRGFGGEAFFCVQGSNSPPKLSNDRPSSDQSKQYGIVDNASAVRYQLDLASLPNADGQYVKPTTDALLKAVARMPGSGVAGVKAPDPAKARAGAYPLTAVVYAASSTDQPKDLRTDYAKVIRYAAGAGQKQGPEVGQLPYGYAPLPAGMRAQALGAASALERGVAAGPPGGEADGGGGGGGPGGRADGGGAGGVGGAGGDAGGGAGGGAAGGAGGSGSAGPGGADPDSSDTATPTAPSSDDPGKETVAKSGGLTPSAVLGLVRWVLLGVLIAGGVAALAGPVLLRMSARRAVADEGT